MAKADVQEFHIGEADHHRLELIQQAFARDQQELAALEAQLQEARQRAGGRLTYALHRLLMETCSDKLPGGRVPEGALLLADWKARTVSVRVPPAQPQAMPGHAHEQAKVDAKAEQVEGTKAKPRGKVTKITQPAESTQR